MDEVDEADEQYQSFLNGKIQDIQHKVGKIPPGIPGECDKCGEDMPRLVEGICCRCRDKYKLG